MLHTAILRNSAFCPQTVFSVRNELKFYIWSRRT